MTYMLQRGLEAAWEEESMTTKMRFVVAVACLLGALSLTCLGQSLSAGTVTGTVTDPTGAVVTTATVIIQNAVTGFRRSTTTDNTGSFRFGDVPPNNYQLSVSANGFNTVTQNLTVRTSVPITVNVSLAIGGVTNTVEIASSESLVESVPMAHTDVDQSLIARLPVRSPGSGLSDVVAFAAPGVAADSNGLFHPLGDHAQTSISSTISRSQIRSSKAFSTQLPVNAIQSLEVTTGAVPG